MKKEKEPERVYVAGYYMTKMDEYTYKVPQGLVDEFTGIQEKHIGLSKMLEGIAAYVADQKAALAAQQNKLWHKLSDGLGLPRGMDATINYAEGVLKITPVPREVVATLIVHKEPQS